MNKKISTTIGIAIITILVILVGVTTWWQYGKMWEETSNVPKVQTPEKKEVKDETVGNCSDKNFDTCNRNCSSDEDCKFTCTCGLTNDTDLYCISKNETCASDKDVVCEKTPESSCKCIKSQCKFFKEEWQTYRNEEYGFEFNYPKKWSIEEKNSPFRVRAYYHDSSIGFTNSIAFFSDNKQDVKFRNNAKIGNFDYNQSTNEWFIVNFSDKVISSCPPLVTLGENIKGYEVGANLMSEYCFSVVYVLTNKDYAIRMEWFCENDSKVVKEIISSFKLINDVKNLEAKCK